MQTFWEYQQGDVFLEIANGFAAKTDAGDGWFVATIVFRVQDGRADKVDEVVVRKAAGPET